MKRKILYLLIVFIVCSCTSMSKNEPVQMDDEPKQTGVPSIEATLDALTPTLVPGLDMIGYEKKELVCTTYLEVTWGSDPGEWGDPIQLPKQSRNDYPAPVFGADGHLYMADLPNHRVLVYDGMSSLPIRTIELSEEFYSDPSVAHPLLPSAMVVTSTGIFIPYGLDKLAMLSLEGKELRDIKLPFPFNPMAPIKQPIWIDSRGGLLLNGVKVVYFDAGWEDGDWNEVSSGIDFVRSPFWWDGYIGGESGVRPKLYKYKFDTSVDFLKEPIEINTYLDPGSRLKGIDKNGWLYFERILASEYALARYNIQSGDKQFGIVSDEISSRIIQASASPDGTIYLISYDPIDQSVQPKMIRCSFPE